VNGSKAAETLPIQLANWRSFYQREFGIVLGNVDIQKARSGSERLIVVAQSLTVDEVLSHCEKYFPISFSMMTPVENYIRHEDRQATHTYAIHIPSRFDYNKCDPVLTANAFVAAGQSGMTLLERLLLELKHFIETGEHVEGRSSATLCTGTWMDSDFIPYVGSDPLARSIGIAVFAQPSFAGIAGFVPWPVTVHQ